MNLCYLEESFVNLRADTVEFQGSEKTPDPLQESQILFGEQLLLLEEKGPWKKVQALDQGAYEGWILSEKLKRLSPKPGEKRLLVQKNWLKIQLPSKGAKEIFEIPMGAFLYGKKVAGGWLTAYGLFSEKELKPYETTLNPSITRETILKTARSFLNKPYLWGGLTPFKPGKAQETSFDCSGLVHLCYRMAGKALLRNSSQQYQNCQLIKTLQPADLLFSASQETPDSISHVMIYEGGQHFIEATQESMSIRRISFTQKYGQALELPNLQSSAHLKNTHLFFASALNP